MLKTDGQLERAQYELMNLPLGFLFENFDGPISTPKGNAFLCAWRPDRKIFDTVLNRFVAFTSHLFEEMPATFTFCPKPANAEQEVEYYVRSAGLPKHAFIWSDNIAKTGLTWRQYCSIRGETNIHFRGRYTFTPLLPQIKNLGQVNEHGFYEMDQTEWEAIFLI